MFGRSHIPLRRFPQFFPAITSIVLIHTVVYFMILLTGDAWTPAEWIRFGAMESWRVDHHEWWRLFSAIFLHVDLLRFLFLCFVLYLLGPQLEWLLGRIPFFLLYYLSGVMAFVAIYLQNLSGIFYGPMGSIYGILGVYLYLFLRGVIHPVLGKSILLLTIIYLAFNYQMIEVFLFSILTGTFIGMVAFRLRRFHS